MDGVFEIRENFKYRIARKAFIRCLLPHHHIHFNFSFQFRLSRWLLNRSEHSIWLDFRGQDGPFTLNTTASVYLEQALSYNLVRQAVEGAVPLSENGKQMLVAFAWKKAVEAIEAVGGGAGLTRYHIVDLYFQVVVRNHHVYGSEKVLRVSGADSSVR